MAARLLSQIVRAAREARGLSQRDLGLCCSPPRRQSAVSQWESGASPLSEATLETVAEALGLSVRELLLSGLVQVDAKAAELQANGAAEEIDTDPQNTVATT